MNKWVKGLALTTLIVCTPLTVAYQMGLQYKIPSFTTQVVQDNSKITNYERKVSLSIAFDDIEGKGDKDNLLNKLNGSSLIIQESKTKDAHATSFAMTVEGEEFRGEQLYTNNNLVFKSPMYHRYVTFFDTEYAQESKSKLSYVDDIVESFLKSTASASKLYSDKGANEDGVKTLEIKGQNEAVEKVLTSVTTNIDKGIPYQSILLNQGRVTNRLLKESSTDSEMNQIFSKQLSSIEKSIQSVLKHSKVTDSEVSLKFNKEKVIKEWNVIVHLSYLNPETNEELPFTLYIDMSTWNVGKAKYKEIETDPTNSIPYEKMTEDIDFFENENLNAEVNASEDKNHVQNVITETSQPGLVENTTTLEALGDDFETVTPNKE